MFFRNILLIIPLFYIIILVSCGLPAYSVAEAPVRTSSDSDTVLVSFDAPVVDENIFGYEIYYKIYKFDSPDIAKDKEKFNSDSAAYEYESGSKKPVELKFNRLQYGEESNSIIPLISKDILQSGQSVVINFSENQILVNNVPIGAPKRIIDQEEFTSDLIEGDSDSNGVVSGDVFKISFVAYSYVSAIITTHQSSIPVFLGTVER
ncbi:MAG: hypothetical protein EH225_03925 [Calditrichaeota bacterium]|nr:MAG: hypothetical protein EH225_03925 [Calditrichota bacterium]